MPSRLFCRHHVKRSLQNYDNKALKCQKETCEFLGIAIICSLGECGYFNVISSAHMFDTLLHIIVSWT